MAKAQFVQEGKSIDYTPDADVTAGDVVVQNSSVGVAKLDIAAGVQGALATGGVFDFVHDAVAKSAGEAVYWDADGNPVGGEAGSGCATKTSSGNTYIGKVVADAAGTDTSVRVRLIDAAEVTNNFYGPLNNLIADPGDGEAIPVTASGRVEVEIADKGSDETNTLAAPAFGGQELLIGCKSTAADDNRVIAVTGCDDGDTITLTNAGEMVRLVGVAKAAAFAWRVVADPDSIVTTA